MVLRVITGVRAPAPSQKDKKNKSSTGSLPKARQDVEGLAASRALLLGVLRAATVDSLCLEIGDPKLHNRPKSLYASFFVYTLKPAFKQPWRRSRLGLLPIPMEPQAKSLAESRRGDLDCKNRMGRGQKRGGFGKLGFLRSQNSRLLLAAAPHKASHVWMGPCLSEPELAAP